MCENACVCVPPLLKRFLLSRVSFRQPPPPLLHVLWKNSFLRTVGKATPATLSLSLHTARILLTYINTNPSCTHIHTHTCSLTQQPPDWLTPVPPTAAWLIAVCKSRASTRAKTSIINKARAHDRTGGLFDSRLCVCVACRRRHLRD